MTRPEPRQRDIAHRDEPDVRRGPWLAAVIAVHALFVAWAHLGMGQPEPPVIKPTVIGMLVAPPPATLTPVPPKPKAATPPKPRPQPRPASQSKARPPAPPMPASKRAVTVPASAPEATETLADQDVMPTAPQAEGIGGGTASPETTAMGTSEASEEPPVVMPRTDAAHLDNPTPDYPPMSRRFGEQGQVLLDVYILPDGSVGELKLNTSSGFARLDEAALAAVRRWHYVPARRGDEAIPFWYVQPVTFSLNR